MSGWAGLAGLLLAVAGAQKQLPQPPRAPPSSFRPAAAEHAAPFDHVFNGMVNRSTERLYSFNYTSKVGQVRMPSPGLPQPGQELRGRCVRAVPWPSSRREPSKAAQLGVGRGGGLGGEGELGRAGWRVPVARQEETSGGQMLKACGRA